MKRAGPSRNQPPTRGRSEYIPRSPGLDRILNHSPAKFRRIWVWVVINSAKKFLRSLLQQRLRRRVIGALGVNCRAGVRNDGLPLRSIRSRLEVEWQARDIHPWDQGIAPEEAAQRFAQQCLEDVDAAISSLFESLPETDEIELRVFDPTSGNPIVAGAVTRVEAAAATAGSVGMKLKSLGLEYRLANWQFESLGN